MRQAQNSFLKSRRYSIEIGLNEKMVRIELTLANVTLFAPLNQTWSAKSNLCNSGYLRLLVFLISALHEFNHQLKQPHFQSLS